MLSFWHHAPNARSTSPACNDPPPGNDKGRVRLYRPVVAVSGGCFLTFSFLRRQRSFSFRNLP
jgi:hypothetical protein